jgi:hypothetical protein
MRQAGSLTLDIGPRIKPYERRCRSARIEETARARAVATGIRSLQVLGESSPERSHTVSFTDPVEDPDVLALVEYLETKAGELGTMP